MPNIHTVSRDAMVTLTGVKENLANEIIKLRAGQGQVRKKGLLEIKGLGLRTLERIEEALSLDYPPPG